MRTSTHFSENQLIKDHPDCEVVNLVGVQLVAEHLRRHVLGRPQRSIRMREVHKARVNVRASAAVVGENERAVAAQKKVPGFDVLVNDAVRVDV